MTRTALAERPEPVEKPVDETPPPAPLRIDPARVSLNHDGYVFGHWFARAPASMTVDDLKISEIWGPFQAGMTRTRSMKKFDLVTVVAFDETWVAEAMVGDARESGVVLVKLKVSGLPLRHTPMPETELYRVAWNGHGYAVFRKADDHQMSRAESSAALAERHLRDLQPVRVA